MKNQDNFISRYYLKDTELFFITVAISTLFSLFYSIRLFVSRPTFATFLFMIFLVILETNIIAKNLLKQNHLDIYQDKMVFCFLFFCRRTVYFKDILMMTIVQRRQTRYLRFFLKKIPLLEATSLRIYSFETGDANFQNIVYTLNNYVDSTIL